MCITYTPQNPRFSCKKSQGTTSQGAITARPDITMHVTAVKQVLRGSLTEGKKVLGNKFCMNCSRLDFRPGSDTSRATSNCAPPPRPRLVGSAHLPRQDQFAQRESPHVRAGQPGRHGDRHPLPPVRSSVDGCYLLTEKIAAETKKPVGARIPTGVMFVVVYKCRRLHREHISGGDFWVGKKCSVKRDC